MHLPLSTAPNSLYRSILDLLRQECISQDSPQQFVRHGRNYRSQIMIIEFRLTPSFVVLSSTHCSVITAITSLFISFRTNLDTNTILNSKPSILLDWDIPDIDLLLRLLRLNSWTTRETRQPVTPLYWTVRD